mgnify:CR=1 FL=1
MSSRWEESLRLPGLRLTPQRRAVLQTKVGENRELGDCVYHTETPKSTGLCRRGPQRLGVLAISDAETCKDRPARYGVQQQGRLRCSSGYGGNRCRARRRCLQGLPD